MPGGCGCVWGPPLPGLGSPIAGCVWGPPLLGVFGVPHCQVCVGVLGVPPLLGVFGVPHCRVWGPDVGGVPQFALPPPEPTAAHG